MASSSFTMHATEKSEPISIEWLLQDLKLTDLERRQKYTKEPLGLILAIVTRCMRCVLINAVYYSRISEDDIRTWHFLTVHMQRDLENIVRPNLARRNELSSPNLHRTTPSQKASPSIYLNTTSTTSGITSTAISSRRSSGSRSNWANMRDTSSICATERGSYSGRISSCPM
jgi:hypothetical protein